MAKHFFRPKFSTGEMARISDSFLETDRALAVRAEVHTLEIDEPGKVPFYGRDCITEWENFLAAKPGLMEMPGFRKMAREAGYRKKMVGHEMLSEGGLFVQGGEFVLASDRLMKEPEIRNATGLPVHFVPSLTSISAGHIDCDYQIIDELKLVYVSHNVTVSESGGSAFRHMKAKGRIKEIAKLHGYMIREYKDHFGGIGRIRDSGKRVHELIKAGKGINSLVDGKTLITYEIHPKERRYLESAGMEVAVVPLGEVSAGAGLRCVYGEFII